MAAVPPAPVLVAPSGPVPYPTPAYTWNASTGATQYMLQVFDTPGNRLLQRYLSEVVSRCSLILAMYGRPHSSDCGITEHRDIVAALRRRDAAGAPSG